MFTGDLTSEQGKQDYENYIMNNVRNEINSYTKQSQANNVSSSVSGASGFLAASVVLPSGIIVPFAGGPGVTPNPGTRQDLPDGWLLCSGAAVSRTAYSALFTIIGTTYGVGDGSTTFNLPDIRGRVAAGKDYDVGGLSNRLTTAGSNINGTVISAAGGNQLLQQHLHSVTDPGHNHSVTDPGHNHSISDPGHAHNYYYIRSLAGYGLTYPSYGNSVYTTDYGRAMSYEGTGISIQNKVTGISIQNQVTGISIQNQGGGTTSSQNVQPTIIFNFIIKT